MLQVKKIPFFEQVKKLAMAEGGHEHDEWVEDDLGALMDTVDLLMSQQQWINEQVQKGASGGKSDQEMR